MQFEVQTAAPAACAPGWSRENSAYPNVVIYRRPLRVIEDIESFRSKLEHQHIEVGAMRHIETVEFPKVEPSA